MWATSQLLLAAFLLIVTIGGRAEEKGVRSTFFGRRIPQPAAFDRNGKSLANTFPFNRQRHQAHHHHHHGDHDHSHHRQAAAASSSSSGRASRQQDSNSNEVALDIGSIASAGEKCVNKVVMVQSTEYQDEIICKHSYSERCHITYKTDYEPQQEEECDDNYRKRCYIEYKKSASEEKVQFCYTPLVRNCDIPSPTECSTEYRSECTTRYHEHEVEEDRPVCKTEHEKKCQDVTQGYTTSEECTTWPVMKCRLETKTVKKFTPETQCVKKPLQVCGPGACPVEQGPEECFDKTETIVHEVPQEQCTLEPQRECKQVTKLVPLLKPAQECVDVPKEVCVRQRTNPQRVQKPVIKKWCYTPTQPPKDPPIVPPITTTTTKRPPTTKPPGTGYGGIEVTNGKQGQGHYGNITPPPITQGCLPNFAADYCPTRSGNGICDNECNIGACGYDGGDCRPKPTTPPPPPPPPSCVQGYPATHCPQRKANGVCDPECDTNACEYDGGDCQITTPRTGYLPPSGYLPPPSNGYQG